MREETSRDKTGPVLLKKKKPSLLAFRWLEIYFDSLGGKGHNQILAACVTCIFSLKKPNGLT